MNRYSIPALMVAVLWSGLAVAQQADELPAPLNGPTEKASYGIGLQLGNQFARDGLDASMISVDALVQGIQDGLSQEDSRITPQEFQEAMQQLQQQLQAKIKPVAEKNAREGQAFLQRYAKVEGVQTLPSGVLYKELKAGNGASPTETDFVTVHYRGRLIDGTEFDSSYKRNEPATFPVNGVIRGWTEALQQMQVGDKWQIVIPPELGYGQQGSPPRIGPNAVLIFDVELLGVKAAPAQE